MPPKDRTTTDIVEAPRFYLTGRTLITRALELVEAYVYGQITTYPLSDALRDYDGNDHTSRIYHAAIEYGRDARMAGYSFSGNGSKETIGRWHAVGEIADEGCQIVGKWAAKSLGSNFVPNIMLRRAVKSALDVALWDFDEVSHLVLKWRFRDGLDGLSPTEELRVAFEAAWRIGKYNLSYALLEP